MTFLVFFFCCRLHFGWENVSLLQCSAWHYVKVASVFWEIVILDSLCLILLWNTLHANAMALWIALVFLTPHCFCLKHLQNLWNGCCTFFHRHGQLASLPSWQMRPKWRRFKTMMHPTTFSILESNLWPSVWQLKLGWKLVMRQDNEPKDTS